MIRLILIAFLLFPVLEAKAEAPVWPWEGVFGKYDKEALRRGLTIYRNICGGCHGLRLVAYRDLEALGLSKDQVKELAAEYEVLAGADAQGGFLDDQGDFLKRPALPSDKFVDPYLSENEAKAANDGALPPDLSLMAKQRKGGSDYLFALLTGYQEPPVGAIVPENRYYNAAFPSHMIAMPPPLSGDPAEVERDAADITAFLTWAAEPTLDARHKMGLKVMAFLIIMTAMMYGLKRVIWRDVH